MSAGAHDPAPGDKRRDYMAGALLVVIGLGATVEAYTYHLGTLTAMGPGFFPFCLGIVLTLLGVAIAGTASQPDRTDPRPATPTSLSGPDPQIPGVQLPPAAMPGEAAEFAGAEWRGWLCIIGGVAAFIVLGAFGGLLPATFACVFISALGDRSGSPLGALVLALVVTAMGAFLFWYLLQVQFPLIRWGAH